MINFKPLTMEDKAAVEAVLLRQNDRGCEYSFANLYLWGRQQVARVGESLVVFSQFNRKSVYLYPVGGDIRAALDAIVHDAAKRGIPCRITGLLQDDCAMLEQLFPGKFRYHIDRDSFDYVYDIHGLADLNGRKYQKKRNHINRFLQEYPDYTVQPLTEDNLAEACRMTEQWYEDRQKEDPHQDFYMERFAIFKALREFKALDMEGMLLKSADRVLAMTMGSPLNETTFDIHFEKALERSDGVYGMINREFARYLREKHPQLQWLNREDDMGLEGLRKAKMSYSPDFMIEKSWACLLEDGYDY